MRALPALLSGAAAAPPSVLTIGDSWGTDIAGGSAAGVSAFQRALRKHNCSFTEQNIAIGGSTAEQWAAAGQMEKTKAAVAGKDYVWITLMGNDALAFGPGCGKTGKSAEQCGDELLVKLTKWMETIIDGIHAANPTAKVVGFGYDIMFGGVGCGDMALGVFPQCRKEADPVACFNTQHARLQTEIWEPLAAARPYVSAPNLLGTTQVAGGDAAAKIGSPDLSKWGPAKYWPTYLVCIHPSITSTTPGGSGAMVIMEEFYQQYWGRELGC